MIYTNFDFNRIIKFKLTLRGELLLYDMKTNYGLKEFDCSYILKKRDDYGYIELKLWEFIKIFGPYVEEKFMERYFESILTLEEEPIEQQKKLVYYY